MSYGIADLFLCCCITALTLSGYTLSWIEPIRHDTGKRGLSVPFHNWPKVPADQYIPRALWQCMDRTTGASLE